MRGDLQKLDLAQDSLTRLDCQYPVYAKQRLALLLNRSSAFLSTLPRSVDDQRQRLNAMLASLQAIAASPASGLRVAIDRSIGGRTRGSIDGSTDGFIDGLDHGSEIDSTWQIDFRPAGLTLQSDGDTVRITARRPEDQALANWLMSTPLPDVSLRQRAITMLAHTWALSMQEDFVLLRAVDGAASSTHEIQAEAMMVNFPSGWQPEHKLGGTLTQLHRPVADGQALRQASAQLSQALSQKGPFLRYVWTLSDTASLNLHPARLEAGTARKNTHAMQAPNALHGIWFRCERQTTLALPQQRRVLFLIRVYVAPLAHAVDSPFKRAALASALRSMSAEVIAYKNIGTLREQVLNVWG